MSTKISDFPEIAERLQSTSGIAWDGCHKIYLLMDDEQMEAMISYGYDRIIWGRFSTSDEMLKTLETWWADSCELRFINAVETNHDDPNAGFESLIPQGV